MEKNGNTQDSGVIWSKLVEDHHYRVLRSGYKHKPYILVTETAYDSVTSSFMTETEFHNLKENTPDWNPQSE